MSSTARVDREWTVESGSGMPNRPRLPVTTAKVYLILLFFLPSTVVLSGPLKSNGSPALLLTLFVGAWGMLLFLQGRFRPGEMSATIMVFVVSSVLSLTTWASAVVVQTEPLVRASATRGLIGLLSFVALTVLVAIAGRRRADRTALITIAVVGLSWDGIVGLLQSYASVDIQYLFKPPGFVLNRSLTTIVRSGYLRANGTSDGPIEFGLLMVCLLALSLLLLQQARLQSSRRTARLTTTLASIGIVVGVAGIPASVSRTAVLSLFAVLVVNIAFSSLRRAVGIISGAGLIGLIYAIFDSNRFSELLSLFLNAETDDSVTARQDDYAPAAQAFGMHPWFGNGLGSTVPSATRYLDNQWLQAVIQGGIVGILAQALLFLAPLGAITNVLLRKRSVDLSRESVTYFALVVVMLVGSFTFDLFAFAQARGLFYVLIGLTAAMASESLRPTSERGSAIAAGEHRAGVKTDSTN